jgi:3-hydroxybutyryl-CoA dehydrogenase
MTDGVRSERIAVVGAGQMGNGIAHVFAQSGFAVTMIDVAQAALDKGKSTIEKNLDRQLKKGTIDAAAKDATLGRIATSTALATAGGAALVIEAATENRELKFRIFADLDKAAPEAILASNTSSISITEIAARTSRPDKVIGMHFMNPVPVMQLVEVIRGLATSEETTRATVALAQAVRRSKSPTIPASSPTGS